MFNEIDGVGITKFVGHKRELNFLKNYIDRLAAGEIKQGVVLFVFGPKGVGKSRIIHELLGYILSKNLFCIQLWCMPYGQPNVVIYDYSSKSIIKFQDLLTVISQKLQYPGIVIIDDIEFAKDQEMVLFKEVFLLTAKSQLLVWCLHRLEFSHPSAAETYYRQIEIPELSLDDTRDMLNYLLGDEIPFSIKSLIVNLAEGIPLYVEETVKWLIKEGIIKKDQTGKWKMSEPIPSRIEVPPSIQCLVMSQLDSLDSLGEKTKEILQIASVIGREFRYKILRSLVKNEDELKAELNRLTKIAIITEKSALTERTFAFKHNVTHQVVYGTVLGSFRDETKNKIDRYLETESRM
ncbi:MAG: hypothetical protein QME68_00590 [Elusimicrobiota bacterium]|nr:hypothetical protein [Elusimicrobiota bacterium]